MTFIHLFAAVIVFDTVRSLFSGLPVWFVTLVAGAYGLCVGSFLNVVILRTPIGRSIVTPPSHCACGRPIEGRDNIPVFGWLLLRGRARCCGRSISGRYPLIEVIMGCLFVNSCLRYSGWQCAAALLASACLVVLIGMTIDRASVPGKLAAFFVVAAASVAVSWSYGGDPYSWVAGVGGMILGGATTVGAVALMKRLGFWSSATPERSEREMKALMLAGIFCSGFVMPAIALLAGFLGRSHEFGMKRAGKTGRAISSATFSVGGVILWWCVR